MTNTKNMNNSEMRTQKIPNSRVCFSYESKSKRIDVEKSDSRVCSTDERESKRVIVNAYSGEEQ